MNTAAKPATANYVYEILVEKGVAVSLTRHPGFLHRAGEDQALSGRHDGAGLRSERACRVA